MEEKNNMSLKNQWLEDDIFFFRWSFFRGHVNFREGNSS